MMGFLGALFGGPANTTYGENTGVLALSKVYDPRVIRIAAYFAILFSFSPKFAALIDSMPAAIVGGISFVLYGMISAIGVSYLLQNVALLIFGANAKAFTSVVSVPALKLADGQINVNYIYSFVIREGCGCAGRYYPERHLPR